MPVYALALDIGEKRIGVAVGSSDVKIAVPNGVVENNSEAINKLKKIIIEKNIDIIVVGLPRNSQGQETKQTQFVREFSEKLLVFELPVVFQDESLTSVEAKNTILMINKRGMNRVDKHKGVIDEKAAAIILTDYLEANFGD